MSCLRFTSLVAYALRATCCLSHLGPLARHQIDGAAPPDVVQVNVEEPPRGALAALVQHLEILEVGIEAAARVGGLAEVIHDDAMQSRGASVWACSIARSSASS